MAGRIDELVTELTKSIKAAQIYQSTHPTFKNFFNQFYQDLVVYLRNCYQLTLQVEKFSIRYENMVVYEETEKDISIAFRLFRDGIREIRFLDGVTADEILIFLEIVSKTDKDQDIALNLWECDFTHIDFYVVEEEEDEKLTYALPQMPKLEADYEQAVRGILEKEKIEFSQSISVDITPEEMNRLKTAIAESENQTPLHVIVSTLVDVLKKIKSSEITESLAEILELCINNSDFTNACMIVNQLWNYADVNLISRIENEALIASFEGLPDILDEQAFSDFVALIGFFSKKSVPYFLRILRNVKNQERLKKLLDRLAYICQGDPVPLYEFLKVRDLTILNSAIRIIGLIGNRNAITNLKNLMLHPSAAVRIALIDAFGEMQEPFLISNFLDDREIEVRIKALRTLEKINYPQIYQRLLKTIRNSSFLRLTYDEQKAYFDCLVANHNDKTPQHLERILYKWILWGKKRYLKKRQLSAQALAKLGTQKAIDILQKGLRKKDVDIRAVCENALRHISMVQNRS